MTEFPRKWKQTRNAVICCRRARLLPSYHPISLIASFTMLDELEGFISVKVSPISNRRGSGSPRVKSVVCASNDNVNVPSEFKDSLLVQILTSQTAGYPPYNSVFAWNDILEYSDRFAFNRVKA